MLQMLKYQRESIELYALWDSADIQVAIKRATNLRKTQSKEQGCGYDVVFIRLLDKFVRFLNVAIEHDLKVLLS
jgi:Uma2 family endonuclease